MDNGDGLWSVENIQRMDYGVGNVQRMDYIEGVWNLQLAHNASAV